MKRMKALASCCNGDGRPVYSSLSKVLCKECFAVLDGQMRALLPSPPAPPRSEVKKGEFDGSGLDLGYLPPRSEGHDFEPRLGAPTECRLCGYDHPPPRSEQETAKELWAPILRMGADVVQAVSTLIVFEKEGAARDAAKKEREKRAACIFQGCKDDAKRAYAVCYNHRRDAAAIRALPPEEGK